MPELRGLCGDSEGLGGQLCRLMSSVVSSVVISCPHVLIMSRHNSDAQDCLEVARCEVSQLTESSSFPTMASMVRPFVPSEVVAR